MSEAASSNLAQNDQEQSSEIKKKNPPIKRRLDHLTDLADGHDQWDMIPRRLSRAYINGEFPESKFRLLLCMMSHSANWHIRRVDLEKIFSDKTIAKYTKELIDEGYITREELPNKTGGFIVLYHVRPLTDWALYRQTADPSLSMVRQTADPSLSGASLSGDQRIQTLQDPKDLNPTTNNARARDRDEKPKPEKPKAEKPKPDPSIPRKGNPLHREAVREMVEEGKKVGLNVKADALALTVDNCVEKLGASIALIREVWPLAIVGMLEKGNARPAAAFFNWMKFEMKGRERQRQYDESRANKSVANDKAVRHKRPNAYREGPPPEIRENEREPTPEEMEAFRETVRLLEQEMKEGKK